MLELVEMKNVENEKLMSRKNDKKTTNQEQQLHTQKVITMNGKNEEWKEIGWNKVQNEVEKSRVVGKQTELKKMREKNGIEKNMVEHD